MFIALEGIDGSGTTTQVGRLVEAFRRAGLACTTTFEPSNGPIGSLLRAALQQRVVLPGAEALDDRSLALLFAADRIDHLRAVIEPALERGDAVITDRYVHSSLAYQGITLDPRWVDAINAPARTADCVVWLDVPVRTCLERMARRGGTAELFEREETLVKVARGYERAMALRPERVIRVDGVGSAEDVAERVRKAVRAHTSWPI